MDKLATYFPQHQGKGYSQSGTFLQKEFSLVFCGNKESYLKTYHLFKKEGISSRFRMARKRVTSLIRKTKHQYFHHIVSSDSKMFWRSVRAINKKEPSIRVYDVIYESDEKKAIALNSFLSCFNLSFAPLNPSTTQQHQSSFIYEHFYTDEVEHKCLGLSTVLRPVVLTKYLLRWNCFKHCYFDYQVF